MKAGQHLFEGGEKVTVPEMSFNDSPCYLTYRVTDTQGKPLKDKHYVMYLADGSVKKENEWVGETESVKTSGPQK